MIHRFVVRRALRSALVATVLLALLAALATPAASAQEPEAWVDVDVENVQFATPVPYGTTQVLAIFTLGEPCYDTRTIDDGAGGWLIQAQRQEGTCVQVAQTFFEAISLGELAPGDHQVTINGTTYDFTVRDYPNPWTDVVVDSVEFSIDGNDTIATASFLYFPCAEFRVIEDGSGGWLVQVRDVPPPDDTYCLTGSISGDQQINLGQLPPGDHQVTINGIDYDFNLGSPWFDVNLDNVQFVTSRANNITHAIATLTFNEPCFDTRTLEDGAGGWLIQAQRQDGTCIQAVSTVVEVINLGELAYGDHQATINGTTYDFTVEIPTGPWFDVEVEAVEFTTDETGNTTVNVSFFTNDPCFNTRVIEDGIGGWLVQAQEQFAICIQPLGEFTETINLGPLPPGDHQVTINGTDYDFTVEGAPSQVLGDVDCDGAMTIVDALMILRYEVGLAADSGSCPVPSIGHVNAAAGDINGDGATNAIDALLIARCAAELVGPGCL